MSSSPALMVWCHLAIINPKILTISIGYSKPKPPNKAPGYTGPIFFPCAIQAPSSYLREQFFAGSYDAGLCAAACNSTTEYNRRHAEGGSYTPCVCPLLQAAIQKFGIRLNMFFFSFPKLIHFCTELLQHLCPVQERLPWGRNYLFSLLAGVE